MQGAENIGRVSEPLVPMEDSFMEMASPQKNTLHDKHRLQGLIGTNHLYCEHLDLLTGAVSEVQDELKVIVSTLSHGAAANLAVIPISCHPIPRVSKRATATLARFSVNFA